MQQLSTSSRPSGVRLPGHIAWIGLGLAACFWLFDTLGDVFLFHEGGFVDQLLPIDDVHTLIDRGQVLAILAIFTVLAGRIIAQRRRTEAALAHHAAKLGEQAELLDLATDAIVVRDFDTEAVLFWSKGAETMYGWPVGDALGAKPHALLRTRFPRPLDEIKAELVRDGRWEGELVHARRDGSLLTVTSRWAVRRDEHGRPSAILEINTDATERKRTEQSLREREANLEASQRIGHLGNWSWDLRTQANVWSDETYRLFGYAPRAIVPTFEAFRSVVHPDDWEALGATIQRALAGGQEGANGNEFRVIGRDGSERVLYGQSEVVCDDHGVPVQLFGTVLDVTERKRIEAELRQARDASEEAHRAKAAFLATMSHEIRTPMNGVIGMTELLLETPLTPEQREYAEAVNSSGETLLRIINDILDFSKMEAGKLGLETFDFDLETTVEDVVGLFAVRAQDKGLELTGYTEPSVPTALRGDPFRLRQILTNLIGNAVKFTEQGEVNVRVGVVEEHDDAAVIRFTISDTGIGMTPSEQSRLFRSFSQADASTTRRYGGTGLGLAISKQLIELMRGGISVDSVPGRGSTFAFTARFAKQPSVAAVERAVRTSLYDVRVMVVDDNATNRTIVHQQVISWGMRNGSAEDGPGALRLLRAAASRGEPYDLAILDMQMPGMDGLALARAIKADPSVAGTRLVMLSSIGHHVGSAAQEAGILAVLTKPVRQSQLYDCLVSVLGVSPEAPPASPAYPRSVEQELAVAGRGSSPLVLIAEDNPVNQRVAALMLQKLSYRVDVVANGQQAIDAHARSAYGAILMDCHMPEVDGYAATAAIRQREGAARHTPIIAMTANAMQGDRERCIAAGMDDYVAKPVKSDVLQATLARWIEAGTPAPIPTAPAALDEAPPIDAASLMSLRQLQEAGDPDILGELVAMLLRDAPGRLAALHRAVRDGDAGVVEREAHALKGSCSNFGAHQMVALCVELQALGRTNELVRAAALLPRLDAAFDRVRDVLSAELVGV